MGFPIRFSFGTAVSPTGGYLFYDHVLVGQVSCTCQTCERGWLVSVVVSESGIRRRCDEEIEVEPFFDMMKIMAKLGENLYKTTKPFRMSFPLNKPKVVLHVCL